MTALRWAIVAVAAWWALALSSVAVALLAAARAEQAARAEHPGPNDHEWEPIGDELAHATDCWCGWYRPRPARKPVGT